jgi:hypothetical protein
MTISRCGGCGDKDVPLFDVPGRKRPRCGVCAPSIMEELADPAVQPSKKKVKRVSTGEHLGAITAHPGSAMLAMNNHDMQAMRERIGLPRIFVQPPAQVPA